jgi:hypothetical protein
MLVLSVVEASFSTEEQRRRVGTPIKFEGAIACPDEGRDGE